MSDKRTVTSAESGSLVSVEGQTDEGLWTAMEYHSPHDAWGIACGNQDVVTGLDMFQARDIERAHNAIITKRQQPSQTEEGEIIKAVANDVATEYWKNHRQGYPGTVEAVCIKTATLVLAALRAKSEKGHSSGKKTEGESELLQACDRPDLYRKLRKKEAPSDDVGHVLQNALNVLLYLPGWPNQEVAELNRIHGGPFAGLAGEDEKIEADKRFVIEQIKAILSEHFNAVLAHPVSPTPAPSSLELPEAMRTSGEKEAVSATSHVLQNAAWRLVDTYDAQLNAPDHRDPDPGDNFWSELNKFCSLVREQRAAPSVVNGNAGLAPTGASAESGSLVSVEGQTDEGLWTERDVEFHATHGALSHPIYRDRNIADAHNAVLRRKPTPLPSESEKDTERESSGEKDAG
jgi:hypothetical protein